MSTVATALTLSALSAAQGGLAARRNAESQAGLARHEAAEAEARAADRAAQEREKARQQAESQKAAYAGRGIALDSDTVLRELAATDADGLNAAQEEIRQGRLKALRLGVQADASRAAGSQAVTAGLLGGLRQTFGGLRL